MNRALQLSRALCGVGALSINILVARHILLSTAQTLQYTGPLFLGLWVFGWYLFKGKKIPWMLFVFLIIGFAGVLLVLRPDVADQNALYVGLGLLSGALSSGSSISLRLLGLKGEPPIRTLFWFALACTLSGGAATLMFSTGLRQNTYSRFQFCSWGSSRHSANGHKTSAGRKAKRFCALLCSSVP